MKDKAFLIEKGMYENTRDDIFWIVGNVYDDIVNNNYYLDENILKRIENLREQASFIFPEVALTKTIIKRLREIFYNHNLSMKKKWDIDIKGRGIYGIKIKDRIVYVGMTMVSFKTRWSRHLSNMKNKRENELYLYDTLRKNPDFKFCVLLNIDDIKTSYVFTEHDVKVMELAFITYFQPKCNYLGMKNNYIF